MTTIDDFSRIVHTIYDAALGPGEWDAALERMSEAMEATACALLTTEEGNNQIAFRSVALRHASVAAYNDYYGGLDFVPAALETTRAGTVVSLGQIVPQDVVARSEIFNDWAHPSACGDGVFSVLGREGGVTSWLFSGATANPEPFATRERVRLARALVPHLQQAIRTQRRLSEFNRGYRDFVSAVDVLPDGIVIVGAAGRAIHVNPVAEAMLATDDGLSVRAGHLAAAATPVGDALDKVVHQALVRGPQDVAAAGCVAVPRRSGLRPYLVRVIPLAVGDNVGVVAPSAMVIVVDPEHEPEPELAALRRLYGLTKSESVVALRVMRGTGLGPIAEELSVSLPTVRTHLQHVFDKTQTHRQAELVRLLLGGLAATRRPATN